MGERFLGVFLGIQKCSLLLSCFGSPPRPAKRVQEAPKRPQEASRSTLRGLQERSRRLQEGLKRPQEPVKRAQNPPKSSQEPPKTPTRLFRSTWSDSRFRKNEKIESIGPQGFSEALGPAAVFGKIKNSKHGSKKHRRRLKSPKSMNPKGLAPSRRMKKGGRAAVIPLGEVN